MKHMTSKVSLKELKKEAAANRNTTQIVKSDILLLFKKETFRGTVHLVKEHVCVGVCFDIPLFDLKLGMVKSV